MILGGYMENKMVVIGLDSINPLTKHFINEGKMPNLSKLMLNGFHSEMISTMPPTTPVAWTTIATGAYPSSHGIEGFSRHHIGSTFDQKIHTTNSETIKAETIWQAAEKQNKKSILLKYPMSWPPLANENVIQIDGAGGWGGLKCVWDLAHTACWDSSIQSEHSEEDQGAWMTRDADNLNEESALPIHIQEPSIWNFVSSEAYIVWETELHLKIKKSVDIIVVYLAGLSNNKVIFSTTKKEQNYQLIAIHNWSQWLQIEVKTKDNNIRKGSVRFKVMDLDIAKKKLKLYQSQIHDDENYTSPSHIAKELYNVAGPFVEWTESYDLLQGWIDDTTQLEIYEQHVEWMIKATTYLMKNYEYDLFMTQLHFLDMAYHIYWGAIDPRHPDFVEEKANYYWNILGTAHEIADKYLGAILPLLDEHTKVFVLGDHGQDVYHTTFMMNHYLLKENLLTVKKDPKNGKFTVDWSKTKVYANGYRIYINMKDRDPEGIVEKSEYEYLINHLTKELRKIYNELDESYPITNVMNRAEAKLFGLYGESMGDLIIAMSPGYQTRSTIKIPTNGWINNRIRINKLNIYKKTNLFQEFTGEHDTSSPMSHNIRTLFFASGKGIKYGVREIPLHMIDVAATIAEILEIDPPAQCEGNSFLDQLIKIGDSNTSNVEFYI